MCLFFFLALAGCRRSAGPQITDHDATPAIPPETLPVVHVASVSPSVTEGDPVSFTLSATPAPAAEVTVAVRWSESGSFLTANVPRTVTIPTTGAATLSAATDDDSADEPDGMVTVTVGGGSGYTLGTPDSATVTVTDNDAPPATPTRPPPVVPAVPGVPGVPDITAPTVESAHVSRSGHLVIVIFDRNLERGPRLAINSFTVTVDGVSETPRRYGVARYVPLDRWVLILVRLAPVTTGQTVTVSYAKPTDGAKLQDTDGNEVESFVQEVTNRAGRDGAAPTIAPSP